MARVEDIARLAAVITKDVARWYADNQVPKAFQGVDPLILARAQILSDGDWRRVVRDAKSDDLMVYNTPQWEPE